MKPGQPTCLAEPENGQSPTLASTGHLARGTSRYALRIKISQSHCFAVCSCAFSRTPGNSYPASCVSSRHDPCHRPPFPPATHAVGCLSTGQRPPEPLQPAPPLRAQQVGMGRRRLAQRHVQPAPLRAHCQSID